VVIIATSAALMVTMVSQPVTRLVPPHRYIAFPALLSGALHGLKLIVVFL
jgi:hypothetical protein